MVVASLIPPVSSEDPPAEKTELNDAQRKAVEHEGGPLLVLAGPGTGKTRVIIHRIAHMINQRGIEPESIVAVTYTVKAAEQLRERLRGLMDVAKSERVNVHTFHGLGYGIIRRFGDMLDLPASVAAIGAGDGAGAAGGGGIIDSAVETRILRRLILDNGLFSHARAKGADFLAHEAREYFRYFEDRGLSPADGERFVATAWPRVEQGLGPDGSPLDGPAAAAERERLQFFEQIVRLQRFFDAECRRQGWLTYGNLISLPIRILKQESRAARILRDEWRHFVVDEFQDVNAAQIELLRLLAPPGSVGAAGPDICVVGDDDQSIYQFRGADEKAFERFDGIWTRAEHVELCENYRSGERVIDLSGSVIQRADYRYAPKKEVIVPKARSAKPSADVGCVECVQLEDDAHAGTVIAAMIRADQAQNPSRPFSKYAVVARSHIDLSRIAASLTIEGIPFLAARGTSAIDDAGVQDVLAWVQLLISPRDVWHVTRLLTRPPMSVPVKEIKVWEDKYRALRSRFEAAERGGGGEVVAPDPGPYVDFLAATVAESSAIVRLHSWHDELRRFAAEHSASDTILRIILLTGVAHSELLDQRGRQARVESLVSLLRFVRERQDRFEAPGGLEAFWSYYQDLDSRDQQLGDSQLAERVDGLGQSGEPDDHPNAVRLITAHSAKGLEFDTVFVPRVSPGGRSGFPSTGVDDELDLPAGFLEGGDERTPKDRQLAEERRLFYVACTRAERRLVLLAKKNKRRSTSLHFFEEIVHNQECKRYVSIRNEADVLRESERLAAAPAVPALNARTGPRPEADQIHEEGLTLKSAAQRRDALVRNRDDCRLAAARALDSADQPDPTGEVAAAAAERLKAAAQRLAVIAQIERSGSPPAWSIKAGGEIARFAEALAANVASEAAAAVPAAASITGLDFAGITGPLPLGFTYIKDYLRCPRCFYVKYQLGLEAAGGPEQILGLVVHTALERFYSAFADADAEGAPHPGLNELLEFGRRELMSAHGGKRPIDRGELDHALSQLRLTFERLHDPSCHLLEMERRLKFDYRCAGKPSPVHRFTVKIDRLDQIELTEGGFGYRIVDYKTGAASKALREPKDDDLQLGIYAMAIEQLYQIEGQRPRGVAEYWVLATGERGTLELEAIRLDKVQKKIDEAVAGIQAGGFAKGKDCNGGCDFLGLN